MIALLVMTDGRDDLLALTVKSARDNLLGDVAELYVYDDTGDPEHAWWLRELLPDFGIICHPEGRQGFGGAIRAAWAWLRRHSLADHVFHLEDDFTFNRPVDLAVMAGVLDGNPVVAQMALRRQAWNEAEVAAGGVIEMMPEAYIDSHDEVQMAHWLEHQLFFTTNPSLYRMTLVRDHDWPTGKGSEGAFTRALVEAGMTFGYWGTRDQPPWVEHTGQERAGVGY